MLLDVVVPPDVLASMNAGERAKVVRKLRSILDAQYSSKYGEAIDSDFFQSISELTSNDKVEIEKRLSEIGEGNMRWLFWLPSIGCFFGGTVVLLKSMWGEKPTQNRVRPG